MNSAQPKEQAQNLPEQRQEHGEQSPREQASSGPPTVLGLKLVPGERVIYFHKLDHPGSQLILGLLGVPCALLGILGVMAGASGTVDGGLIGGGALTALVGLGLIFVAALSGRGSTSAHVVTTQRVIAISGPGARRGVSLEDVWDLRAERQGGSLLRMAVEALHDSDSPTMAPSYWNGATSILMMDGGFALRTPEPTVLGPFLARCLQMPGFADRCAGVPYEP
jgi:hypothetical protein